MAKRSSNDLTEQQTAALSHIAQGKSIAETARLINVNRGSIQRWFRADPHFRAAYNAWQIELRESAQARLLSICEDAVNAIHRAIQKDDAKCAMEMLRRMGMLDIAKPGSPDAAEIVVRDAITRRKLKVELSKTVDDVTSDELINGLHRDGGELPGSPVSLPRERTVPIRVTPRPRRALPAPGRGTAR
jgi:hypothetical protein